MQPHSSQLGQQLLALGCRLRTKVAVCCCVGHRHRAADTTRPRRRRDRM